MYSIGANGNKIAYGIKHFIVDTYEDVKKISVSNLTPGSTAFIIDKSENYMLNNKNEWVKVNLSGLVVNGGGGSGGDIIQPPNDDDIIYEGGEV